MARPSSYGLFHEISGQHLFPDPISIVIINPLIELSIHICMIMFEKFEIVILKKPQNDKKAEKVILKTPQNNKNAKQISMKTHQNGKKTKKDIPKAPHNDK